MNHQKLLGLKKSIVVCILMLLLFLILSGCKSSGTSSRQAQLADSEFRKGTEGVVIAFLKNAPPDKIFEETLFPIALSIKNNGATDIGALSASSSLYTGNGYLAVGTEQAYVSVIPEGQFIQPIENFHGKSPLSPKGSTDVKTFEATSKRIGTQSETHPSTVFVTACYPYKTSLGTSICVDTDPFGLNNRKKVCTVKDLSFSGGQGGPVAITKIEARMAPSQDTDTIVPYFILTIENRGNGEVIRSDDNKLRDACSSNPLQYTDFNRIKVTATLGGLPLTCGIGDSFEATLRLRNKKDMVNCYLKDGVSKDIDPYTSPLRIDLDYGYTFTISKDIIIQKILRY